MKSIVRTLTPLIVGALLSLPFAPSVLDAFRVSQEHFTTAVALVLSALVVALSGVYYSVVRWAEIHWPLAGVLLGWIGAPLYARTVKARIGTPGPVDHTLPPITTDEGTS
jgi:hypothetical protein